MSPSAPSDQTTRDQIGPWAPADRPLKPLDRFEPDTNFVVCAAAGSGKTTALIGRMVSLIRTGVPVGDLVAITFTKKAAGEMQGRFYTQLRAAEDKAKGDEQRRLQRALEEISQCFIGTIHAFCARLLRGRSEEIGIPRDFNAGLEERDKEELRDQFWQQYLQASWEERRSEVEALFEAGVDLGELKDFFGDLTRVPELSPHVDGAEEPPDLSAAVEEAKTFFRAWETYRPPEMPDARSPCDALQAFNRAERFLTFQGTDTLLNQAQFLALFEGLREEDSRSTYDTDYKGTVTVSHWKPSQSEAKELRDKHLAPFVMETVEPALRQWKSYVHRLVAHFAHDAVDAFREARWSQGQLTFHDLLLAARDLLRGHPAVRRSLRAQYPRLLVDEFQDTDPVQAEVLFYLTHESEGAFKRGGSLESKENAEEGGATGADDHPATWQDCTPAPGSLFIVGDDKQSIYSFREADIDLFDTVRRLIDEQECGAAVTLQTNFRSVEGICAWCNEAFRPLFHADQAATEADGMVQAEYVPFEPWHSASDSSVSDQSVSQHDAAVKQLRVPYVKGKSYSSDIARRNAHQIARYIQYACSRGEKPGDFMILTRDTTRLSIFGEVLAERGIPYVVAGGKDAGDSEELRGLVDLLTAVYRPDDPVARLAYLRGPLVGLRDEELYRFVQAGGGFDGPLTLPERLRRDLDNELVQHIQAAYGQLEKAHALLKEKRPATAIGLIAEETGLLARALQDAGQGSLKAGRFLRILEEVRHLDGQGASWADILEELERVLVGEASLDGMTLETGQKDENGEPGGVQLLNVHKAKGLEADVVFLADPYNSQYPRDPERHVRRLHDEVVQPVFVEKGPYHKELKYGPMGWYDFFQEEAKRAQLAEEHRLQYVAATRAKRLLVVSRYEKKPDKGYWADLYTHLDAQDAPDLEVPDSEPQSAPGRLARVPKIQRLNERRRSAFEAAATPSFRLATVTKDSKDVGGHHERDGYGSSFGSAVHAAFEVMSRQGREELGDQLLTRILEEHLSEVTEKHLQRARRMVEDWTSSSFWKEVKKAQQVLPEVPVATYEPLGRDGQEPNSGAEHQLMRGVIDLAFETEHGWTLVDFKTDRVSDQDVLDTLTDHYTPQISAYAEHWTAQAHAQVHRAGLWFADPGEFVPVHVESAV
jgi:ATP-dependent helicase/nuclease subunit A